MSHVAEMAISGNLRPQTADSAEMSNEKDKQIRMECLRQASGLLHSGHSHDEVVKAASAFYDFIVKSN